MFNKGVKYDRHKEEWDACINDPDRRKIALTWLKQSNTLDRWRHERMYALVNPLINNDITGSWLTVGDGRFGTDAHALKKNGAQNVHCSDISDTLLKIGSDEGFIDAYSSENAEGLSFSDDSFDFVYCKEAFHHFPRPYIALNEMYRVAKNAVILTEPRDHYIDRGLLHPFFNIRSKLFASKHGFEPVGNYIYSLSEHEMEKFLLGFHRNIIAFKGLNDAYMDGVEFVNLNSPHLRDKILIKTIKAKIFLRDILEKTGLRKSNLLTVILFKMEPSKTLLENLTSLGWKVKILPKNPYL